MSGMSPYSLQALEQRLREELHLLGLPARPWSLALEHPEGEVLDVIIVGGGMSGLAAAAALKLQGLQATVFDRAERGREGPWLTTALMETLRSPKEVTGPALDLPSLTFAAWYQAQFGTQAWTALDKIPRQQWAAYLQWYRQVMDIEVHNGHEVLDVIPRPDAVVEVLVSSAAGTRRYLARRVVLALGLDAFGKPEVPAWAADLPRRHWSHSVEPLDYASLRGRRVAVIGASAAAMDCAATALEAGAEAVELLVRRADFPRLNRSKGSGNAGMIQAYRDLPDAWKWRLAHTIASEQIAPPRGSTLRVTRHANAFINFASPVHSARVHNGQIELQTPTASFVVDHVILGTGFCLDWSAHAPYARFAGQVQLWRDRFTAPHDQVSEALASNPYLGPALEFLPRTPGALPGLERIHCFCFPAGLSAGYLVGNIPGVGLGARRLAEAIAARLYDEDRERHFQRVMQYDEPELFGDEWQPALPVSLRHQPVTEES